MVCLAVFRVVYVASDGVKVFVVFRLFWVVLRLCEVVQVAANCSALFLLVSRVLGGFGAT